MWLGLPTVFPAALEAKYLNLTRASKGWKTVSHAMLLPRNPKLRVCCGLDLTLNPPFLKLFVWEHLMKRSATSGIEKAGREENSAVPLPSEGTGSSGNWASSKHNERTRRGQWLQSSKNHASFLPGPLYDGKYFSKDICHSHTEPFPK